MMLGLSELVSEDSRGRQHFMNKAQRQSALFPSNFLCGESGVGAYRACRVSLICLPSSAWLPVCSFCFISSVSRDGRCSFTATLRWLTAAELSSFSAVRTHSFFRVVLLHRSSYLQFVCVVNWCLHWLLRGVCSAACLSIFLIFSLSFVSCVYNNNNNIKIYISLAEHIKENVTKIFLTICEESTDLQIFGLSHCHVRSLHWNIMKSTDTKNSQ